MIHEDHLTYHANSAVSHSKLETFRRRPALYYRKYVTKQIPPEEPGTAFRIGSAAHCSILEPLEMAHRYAIRPEGIDRRTKDGRAQWAIFEAENEGRTIIDTDEAAQILNMTDAVRQHDLAAQLLAHGQPELTWRTGGSFALQCRTDWFNPNGCELSHGRPYIADVKTVESLDDSSFANFERAVFRYGYHRQVGFYLPLVTELLGKPVFNFFFIVVEKCEPYGVAVYRTTDAAAALGQDETLDDLRRLKRCMDLNEWLNIEPTLREIGVPSWYGKGGAS
jgi:hypothetical protein